MFSQCKFPVRQHDGARGRDVIPVWIAVSEMRGKIETPLGDRGEPVVDYLDGGDGATVGDGAEDVVAEGCAVDGSCAGIIR